MKIRNMLLVSYHFPPVGGSGVQRALKMARYLPRAGWRPQIICAGHAHYPLLDPTLLADLPDSCAVHRVRGCEPGGVASSMAALLGTRTLPALHSFEKRVYWRLGAIAARLRLPELELLWAPAATKRALRLAKHAGIDAVITSSPPCASHLVGRALKRRLGMPWIADLRDPMVGGFAYRPDGRWSDRFWRRLESMVMQTADAVVVTCPELRDRLLTTHADARPDRVHVIPNGYDPADAPYGGALRPYGHRNTRDHLTLVHVGSLYQGQSVQPFLTAISRMRAGRMGGADKLAVRLVGSMAAAQRQELPPDVGLILDAAGYVSHRDAIDEMTMADALVLLTPPSDGGRLCIPAKTYEYLAFGGHIVALVHRGSSLARLLASAGNVTLAYHGEPGSVERALGHCLTLWRNDLLNGPRNRPVVERFRRDILASELADVLNHVLPPVAASLAESRKQTIAEAAA